MRRFRIRVPLNGRGKLERQLWENDLMEAAEAGLLELVEVRPYYPGLWALCVRKLPGSVQPLGKIA